MHKPTTGPSRAHARQTTGDAGPLDGNPAPNATDRRPASRAGGALAAFTRALHLAPRPETAIRRFAPHRRDGARPATVRRRGRGPVAGQLSLLDLKPSGYRAALAGLGRTAIRQDRSIAFLVAALVVVAFVAAAIPSSGTAAEQYGSTATGQTDGLGVAPRMPVGQASGDGAGPSGPGEVTAAEAAGVDAGTLSADANLVASGGDAAALSAGTDPAADQGAFLPDGTLLKPIAVDTSIPDTKTVTRTYRVKPGDTLTKIAGKFGLSNMMSIWWANHLKSKSLKPGMKLIIPTDDGLLVKVKEGDSLDRIARTYDVDPAKIQEANGLADEVVYIGQTLFVPGGQGAPVATPRPKPKPQPVAQGPDTGNGGNAGGGGGSGPSGPVHYGGGRMSWPVVGGGNYVSQYFHYGHPALDIAGSYGSPVVAAAGGRVIFAGWRSNGGGYQVWIDHGNGIYTTYNHMSAVSVGAGQTVGAGQRIGSLGSSGWATGPHLHFEVWSGYPWSGGTRINPLAYVR